ncbi:MAG: argininosuccinate synthase [Acidimicrobiales bacterium]
MAYAADRNIPIEMARGKKSPFSMDANLLHISYEGGPLEDPWTEPPSEMWRWSVSPEMAPNDATYVDLTYEKGDIVAIDGVSMTPAQVLTKLNELGGANGIGRLDIVENRFVGIKSRGAYETPGGTIMLRAHRAIESITLDREVCHLKDDLMPRYAKMIYNGYWFAPERVMLQQAIDHSQLHVNGEVRVKLYKGNVDVVGRRSAESLFDEKIATFEDDGGAYNQADAEGFIKLNALRLRTLASKRALRHDRRRSDGQDPVAWPVRRRAVRGVAAAERLAAVRPADVRPGHRGLACPRHHARRRRIGVRRGA